MKSNMQTANKQDLVTIIDSCVEKGGRNVTETLNMIPREAYKQVIFSYVRETLST